MRCCRALPYMYSTPRRLSDSASRDNHTSCTPAPPGAAWLAGRPLGRAGSLPQGTAHWIRRRRAGRLPGAVASPACAPWRSCLFLPWLAPGHHAPPSGPPVQSSYSFNPSWSAIAACLGFMCSAAPNCLSCPFPGLPCSVSIPSSFSVPAVVAFSGWQSGPGIASSLSSLGEVHLGSYSCLSAAIILSYPLCISRCGQLCTLHRLPDGPLLLRFRIGRLGTDLLHPTFHTRWAQMLAWTVCIGCLVRACSRGRAYPPERDRLSLPLLGGPPLMDALDFTHGLLRCWRAGAWGGLGAGAPARFRR